jgi:ABC-type bacteriocin/lantibiotic exporter with double-glycine peptidase domain
MENSPYLSPLKRFWRLLKPDNKEITFLYVYAFFIGIVQLSLPLGIQSIINLIQGGQMSTSLIILILFVIIGVIVSGALHLNQLRITENLQQKIFVRAAFEFAYRIPKIKLEALYKHYSPELMNRFFDIVSIQKGLSKILLDFSTASIQTVFGLLLLSLYHPFFIIFSLILIILIYSIFKFTSKKGLKTSLTESKNKYNVANWLEELARSSISFKLAGTATLHMDRINTSVNSYISARDEHFKILRKQYLLMIVFKVLVASGLLIVGSILVIDQHINIGQFVAAEIIILLVISSVEKLILSLETIYDVLTSLEKVGQITDLPIELDEGLVLPEHHHTKGLKVDLNKVTFSYPEQEETILKNVSLEIKANEKVVIKGIGESGKTTLLYLIAGLYKTKTGTISFNDFPFENLNPNNLRNMMGECMMDESLFEGTILENIAMGRVNASIENVQWAIEKLGLIDFVKSLPKGYDTKIYANGKHISKSTIDKILIARAIAEKPKLLLIKDNLSTIEFEERKKIVDFLMQKEMPWTLIVATKDPIWETNADRIVLLENGELINDKSA